MDPRTVVEPHYTYTLDHLPHGWRITTGHIAPPRAWACPAGDANSKSFIQTNWANFKLQARDT